MFLKQIPRSGDWKVIAASLIALTVTGCANLGTTPDNAEQASVAVAVPVLTQDIESETVATQEQVSEEAAAAIDLEAIAEVGLPFWLAGSYGTPEGVVAALDAGATGVQVGTAFAYSEESGFATELKEKVLAKSKEGSVEVFTDPLASPTGFPFKVVSVEDTMSNEAVYEKRTRVCDLGYLRTPYRIDDDTVGWRCPSEPVQDFVRKGGDLQETEGRKCICNALLSTVDLAQTQKDGEVEAPIVTSGDDAAAVGRFLRPGATSYSAADVVAYLLRDVT